LQHETKVDVYQVSLAVYHYVAVVSVFYRKQICEYAVARQTANEVCLGFFELTSEVPFVEIS
jgi:hypothetical protein